MGGGEPPKRDDQGPGHAGGSAGHPTSHRRRGQRQHYPPVRPQRYRAVADVYMAGLEERVSAGKPVDGMASVASFFLSRIDTMVDPMLEEKARGGGSNADLARQLRGKDGNRQRQGGLPDLQQDLRERPVPSAGESWRSGPTASLGKHQHQEPGIQRRDVRRAAHRSQHREHDADGDPGGVSGSRQSRFSN